MILDTPSPGFFITLTAAGGGGGDCSGVFAPDTVMAVANAATVLFSEPDPLCAGNVLIQAIASRGALAVTGSTTVVAEPKS